MIEAPDLCSVPTQSAAIPAIDPKGVTKTYARQDGGAVHALGPVDLRIESGSFVSVVGPSGCGKSTLLRLVAGLEMPNEGIFANLRPQMLSGGMKQRASFCRAMLSDPRLLLLDEPFGALDALTREEMSLELSRLWQELGRTALLITHDIEEAILLGDRVLVMSERPGTIRIDIPVDLPRPRNAETVKLPRFHEIKNHIRDIIFIRAQA
jgi:ABC-type nitrate/sulfonate/bicarbonate transport system ATPase subunit